jgi:radical SAM superfamily enzyme YgiQ (UPF0313 family)
MEGIRFPIIPIESGRGCPYGCEFCTVTGFFGDSIRFRSNQSIVEELLMLKARAPDQGQVAVLFVDDNFAINGKRIKDGSSTAWSRWTRRIGPASTGASTSLARSRLVQPRGKRRAGPAP